MRLKLNGILIAGNLIGNLLERKNALWMNLVEIESELEIVENNESKKYQASPSKIFRVGFLFKIKSTRRLHRLLYVFQTIL
jgi:hypothetical protein